MADEGMESGEASMAAASAVLNGPSAAADVEQQIRRRLREAALDLLRLTRPDLAELVATTTLTRVLNDDDDDDDVMRGVAAGDRALSDEFRRSIRRRVRALQQAGYDERAISDAFPRLVLRATRRAAGLDPLDDDDDEPYRNGGFGAVPASAAAARSLEKQTFRAAAGGREESVADEERGCGVTECSICFDEFVDGAEVSVMPCQSHVHRFHPDCIAKWLGISNLCPLCRHELPTAGAYDQ